MKAKVECESQSRPQLCQQQDNSWERPIYTHLHCVVCIYIEKPTCIFKHELSHEWKYKLKAACCQSEGRLCADCSAAVI